MSLLFLDTETFFDKKAGYDLRSLSMVEYVRDGRFKFLGAAMCEEGPPAWFGPDDLPLSDPGWSELTLVGHNLKFDGSVLARLGVAAPAQYIDTKALARAVLGKQVEGYSLSELAVFFDLPPKQDMPDLSDEAKLAEYCRHDVWLCREIYHRCIDQFPTNQLPHLDWTIRSFVYPKLVVDTAILDAAVAEEKRRKAALFEGLGIPKATFSSSKKFTELMAAKGCTLPTKKSPRTGKEIPALSKADSAFHDLLNNHDKGIVALCEARREAKSTIMETRCESLSSVGKTGPWPFDVEYSGAAQTHRYSGGGAAGGNPQNFVRDSALRAAVLAPPGHVLVVGDFAAVEMRIVAYLAKDPALIRAIEAGRDVYCDFASKLFKRPVTKADKELRWAGKTAMLAFQYCVGAMKFQSTVKIQTGLSLADDEADRAVKLYRTQYWRIPQLWAFLEQQLPRMARGETGAMGSLPVRLDGGRIRLPSGLMLQYPGLRVKGRGRFGKTDWVYDVWGKKNTREESRIYGGKILENISQALAGELAKEVNMRHLQSLVGACHDEVILAVPEEEAEERKAELEKDMQRAPTWMPRLNLQCEVGCGKTWKEAKA